MVEQKSTRTVVLVLVGLLLRGLASAAQPANGVRHGMDQAAALERAGNLAGAVAAYRAVLARVPGDDPGRGAILEALALAETNLGDYEAGGRDATAAAGIHRRMRDMRGEAHALNTAGLASMYAGRYDAAANALTGAIALSASGHDDEGRAEQLTNLANVHFYTGRYADALRLYTEALALADAHGGDAWAPRRRFLVQANRAALDQRLGRHEEALAAYRDLEGGSRNLRPREQAQILSNEGVVYRNLGDPIKALAAYDRALDLFSRDHHADGELGVLKNRGIALALDLHDFATARRSFSEALRRAAAAGNRREVLQARLYRGEVALREGAIAYAGDDFSAAVAEAEALKTPEELWKALYGTGRVSAAAGDAGAARESLDRAVATIEGIRERLRIPLLKSDFFSDKREVYDALIALELERGDPKRLFGLIERSRSRVWRERLGLTDAVALDAVQRALPADSALLEFWNSSSGSAVVVVTRDRAAVTRIRIDETAIQRFADRLRRGPYDRWQDDARAIAADVWPGGAPGGVRHVIVVPDGAVAALPFELLAFGPRLLVEQAAVSYLPTAAMLLRVPPAERVRPPWRVQLSAFADPVPARSDLDGVSARLAGANAEVQAIAGEISGLAKLHVNGDDLKSYLRRAEAPIVHIASHAVADTSALERSRILFSPAAEAPGDADYLFLKEAYDLDLNGVELAVLSACDTERGRTVRGEGIQSFSRAFLAAGVHSTVTTLWRVPDVATARFMTTFYRHLQRGVSRAEALREAKLEFLRSGTALADPHFWAAFVLTGDGARPVSFPPGWLALILTGSTIVAIGCAATFVARRRNMFR